MPTQIITVRGILFDMDGVLISSTGADERCWMRWARHHGMEGSFSLQSTHGRRAVDTLRDLRPDLDPEPELRRLEGYDAEDHRGLVVLPGVQSLLASLPPDRWTIVTSATTRLIEERVRYAGLPLPPGLVSAETVVHGKPHPGAVQCDIRSGDKFSNKRAKCRYRQARNELQAQPFETDPRDIWVLKMKLFERRN